ncbi:NUDIX hydrolase [archaeon]|nr:MAG: NUDIX hydrolase [archaeon]
MRGIPHLPESDLWWIWKRATLSVVECIVESDGKILLTKRAGPPWKGWWHIPGGLVAYNETLEHAVKRVVKEDTGLDVSIVKFLGHYSKPGIDPRGHIIGHIYLCRVVSGKLKNGKKVSDVQFFSKMPRVPKHHKELLRKYGLL